MSSITPAEEKDLPVAELFKRLSATDKGLSTSEAAKRLQQYGANEIAEKKRSPILAILRYFWGPIPWMIEAAAVISAVLQNWDDLAIISALLVVNVIVRSWQENKASNEIELLKKRLALTAKALRDGKWADLPARELVPGDIVRLRLGNIVPADTKLVDGAYLQIDESALTGESLPVEKHPGDVAFSSSIIRQGEMNALVVTTGMKTFYGRTTKLVEEAHTKSHFQGAVVKIGDYLIALAVAMVTATSVVGLLRQQAPLEILQFGLVLIVAAIPAAMPAVLSICMTVGASALAKKEAIVSKLVAIDEMAGVDILCADKTGTITKNELSVGEVKTFEKYAANDVLLYATLASRAEDKDPIDDAIIAKAKTMDGVPASISSFKVSSFKPFDPVSKRTEATAQGKDGQGFQVTKGAPQVVLALVYDKGVEGAVNQDVNGFAEKGYRALGVARSDGGKDWKFVGLIALSDPPREDSAATIKTAQSMGITVKMVTGDHVAIAKEVCREVGLGTNIVSSSSIVGRSDSDAESEIESVDGFAEVFPEHKYKIVELLQKKGHIVSMTGDGVNDAPALKKADCGIAVAGATDAAKSAAAVVLTKPGLSVIIDAVTESRKIFQRMTNYAIYRISETFRVLFFISLSIIAFQLYPVTALMIVLLALLNDMPIMTIAYDNVKISQKPEKWNMRTLLTIASFLGGIGTVSSFGILIIGLDVLHLNPLVLQSFIYLKLSVAGHLELFVARTKGRFWSVRPARVLLLAVILTQLTATIITVYGILLPAMGWELAGLVWGYALASFLVTDFLKVGFYGRLNRESKVVGKGEATTVLRTVTPDKAFNFYRDYGQPLHVTSRSLEELAASVKSIEPSSVRFHVEEGEFESWFAMLGDESLARQVAKLRDKNTPPDKLRAKVSEMVSKRVEELHKIADSKEKGARAPSVSRLHKFESAITSRLHRPGKNVGKDEAVNALRTVTPDKAFNFYDEAGKPLGVTSKSLDDLAASLKSVDPTSVKFHLEKGDFEGWFAMLGDKSLAGQVAKLRGKDIPPDKLKEEVGSMVSKRVEQLHKIAGAKEKGAKPPSASSDKTKNTADKDTGLLHSIESAIRSRLRMAGKDLGKDEAANALRRVTPDKVFAFYSETGKPLDATAKSLDEFATVLKGVDPSSVKFHVEEGDFEKWFTMLGDESLARQVARLRGKNASPDKLTAKVSSIVGTRVEQLHKIAGLKGSDAKAHASSPAKP